MTYLGELRSHWRPLLAAAVGLGSGLSLNLYITSIFAPYLLADFGWSKSQFALTGSMTLLTLFCMPVIGRLTDRFGVRRMATVGVVAMPLSFLAFSAYHGGIGGFVVIYGLQIVIGTATSATVYSRLVAERFDLARGIALAIVSCGPALVGAIGSPLLNGFIEAHGWRAGYQALAAFSTFTGAIALMLVPSLPKAAAKVMTAQRPASRDYAQIIRQPAFWILVGGIFLCSPTLALHNQQMKMMLLDNGASSSAAAMMISSYAVGVIVGRFACGLALDRLPAHAVAAISMGLPSIGLFMIASSFDSTPVLAAGVMLMGLSMGAEGDIMGFLVMRYFGVQVYSSVLGLSVAGLGIASAMGSALLSLSLKLTDSFTPFIVFCGFSVLIGASLFTLLGRPSIARMASRVQASQQADNAPGNLQPAAGAHP